MKTLLRWTNGTTVVRGVCTVCGVLILLGLFAPHVLLPLQPQGFSSPRPSNLTPQVTAESSVGDPGARPGTEQPNGGGATVEPAERSPLINAFGDLVDQNARGLGPMQTQLQADLDTANGLLLDAKRSNQAALRQANRHIRQPGRSPNLLLVILEGVSCDSLHCYHEPAGSTPGFDRLAAHGLRLTRFDPT